MGLLPVGTGHDALGLEHVLDVRGLPESEALRRVRQEVWIAIVEPLPELVEERVARARDRGAHVDEPEVAGLVIELHPLQSVAGPSRGTVDPVPVLVEPLAQGRRGGDRFEGRAAGVLAEGRAVEERLVGIRGVLRDRGCIAGDEGVQVVGRPARDRQDLSAPRVFRHERALPVAEGVLGRALHRDVQREDDVLPRQRGTFAQSLDNGGVGFDDRQPPAVRSAKHSVERRLEAAVGLADEVASLHAALCAIGFGGVGLARFDQVAQGLGRQASGIAAHACGLHLHAFDDGEPRSGRVERRTGERSDRHERVVRDPGLRQLRGDGLRGDAERRREACDQAALRAHLPGDHADDAGVGERRELAAVAREDPAARRVHARHADETAGHQVRKDVGGRPVDLPDTLLFLTTEDERERRRAPDLADARGAERHIKRHRGVVRVRGAAHERPRRRTDLHLERGLPHLLRDARKAVDEPLGPDASLRRFGQEAPHLLVFALLPRLRVRRRDTIGLRLRGLAGGEHERDGEQQDRA